MQGSVHYIQTFEADCEDNSDERIFSADPANANVNFPAGMCMLIGSVKSNEGREWITAVLPWAPVAFPMPAATEAAAAAAAASACAGVGGHAAAAAAAAPTPPIETTAIRESSSLACMPPTCACCCCMCGQ